MMITIYRWRDADKHMDKTDYDVLISIGWKGENHCTKRASNNFIGDVRDVTPLSCRGDHQALLVDAPNMVVDLIRFGRTFNPMHRKDGTAMIFEESTNIISHCQAGVSRSTACALIFLVAAGWFADDAIKYVYDSRGSKCQPNWYFLAIADRLMNTNILGTCQAQGRKLKSTRRDLKV